MLFIQGNNDHTSKTQAAQTKPKPKSIEQVRREFAGKILNRIHEDDFDSEEERMRLQEKIERKIKSGAKLSQKEMNYLRKYNPYLYQQMVRVQQKREALKEQLRHCRTKEEAQRVMSMAMTSISDKDPAREAMVAAVQNVSEQFRSSEAYEKLPETEEDLKKAKENKKPGEDPFEKDEDDADDGDTAGEVSYSFTASGYQEATVGTADGTSAFVMGA